MNKESKNDNRTMVVKREELDNSLAAINLLDEKDIAQAEYFLKKILTSDKSGLKSVQDGLAIMLRAGILIIGNLPSLATLIACILFIHLTH